MNDLIVKEIRTINSVILIAGFPMFLATNHGTLGFDQLENPLLAPLLLIFWQKLSAHQVQKGFTQLSACLCPAGWAGTRCNP
jgi:hypothetical protein